MISLTTSDGTLIPSLCNTLGTRCIRLSQTAATCDRSRCLSRSASHSRTRAASSSFPATSRWTSLSPGCVRRTNNLQGVSRSDSLGCLNCVLQLTEMFEATLILAYMPLTTYSSHTLVRYGSVSLNEEEMMANVENDCCTHPNEESHPRIYHSTGAVIPTSPARTPFKPSVSE
jgi:hypothetical protein